MRRLLVGALLFLAGDASPDGDRRLRNATTPDLPALKRGAIAGGRFAPTDAEFPATVFSYWDVLDRFAVARNFGCVDKSPASNAKTMCNTRRRGTPWSRASRHLLGTARSDRFNPYVFGYMRPAQMEAYARHIRLKQASTYCEVGMNAGHGTVAVLLASRERRVARPPRAARVDRRRDHQSADLRHVGVEV